MVEKGSMLVNWGKVRTDDSGKDENSSEEGERG